MHGYASTGHRALLRMRYGKPETKKKREMRNVQADVQHLGKQKGRARARITRSVIKVGPATSEDHMD